MTIVVCGEALLDVFAVAHTPTGVTLDGRVGGSPFNVAVGLTRLGVHTTFLASLSRGFLGDRLLRALREEGVGTEAVGTVVGREQADEAARVERFAQAVLHRPAAAEIEGSLGADGVALDVQAARVPCSR